MKSGKCLLLFKMLLLKSGNKSTKGRGGFSAKASAKFKSFLCYAAKNLLIQYKIKGTL
jgi:hypothetical protein